jgi:hypothetical protein
MHTTHRRINSKKALPNALQLSRPSVASSGRGTVWRRSACLGDHRRRWAAQLSADPLGSASESSVIRSYKQVGLLGLWIVSALLILRGGTQFGYYARGPEVESSHPIVPVLFVLGFSLLELVAAWGILRPATYQRSWHRSGFALALVAPWSFISAGFVMHGPGFHAAHALWVLALTLVLAIAFLVSSTTAASHTLRARRPKREQSG